MARVVVDPIPRIEGHLRIEVEVENGKVKDAWSTGTLFRGLEIILQGRDPRDAHLITQRSCGVCTLVHSLASVRAVEDALKIKVPTNARLVRNLTHAAQNMHDHPVHFYQLCALDWVDVVSALSADPKKTSDLSGAVSGRPQTTKYYEGLKGKLKAFVDSGQLGPFANAYWGHPAYKLPPEANLMAVGHYLDNLRQQVFAAQMTAIWGAKNPHLQGHLPGGVTVAEQLNADRISQYLFLLREQIAFIEEVYIPDLLAVASFYKDWAKIGGNKNFLAYGDFPQSDVEPDSFYFPRGAIVNGELKLVKVDPTKITEEVTRSWYEGDKPLHPSVGETKPLTGDKLKGAVPDTKSKDGKYSWIKAPRYDGQVMEVGPLAQCLVSYTGGNKEIKDTVDGVLKKLEVGPDALFSTLGRVAARGIKCLVNAKAAEKWTMELVENIKKGDTKTFTPYKMDESTNGQGAGMNDVARGSLGHWVNIEKGKIKNYQQVVPSTWNLGPSDGKNQKGPVENALIGTPVADPKKPLEVLRTVHSFDPCIACAVHVIDPKTNEVYKFRVS
ncbi:nickel-dependent hydrogenase large subunit [Desulfomonile tiedjei]|uniref:Ni,Fe-hydrogenase I large subunit n=1 Tax=Desulfomonile tiedjei (strain ATCC 49306 / DSM 6799 / DCB-1) TaxID=706587 RepID=I4C9Z8_DESTA|nr:nickel-dependent hydrogenase large subunit [Desulfomonile tiedjei]AFM26389.1 Ni,Fe-hydrogenase I large subunit [Desulfomonile tiedjei DSM 6799]